MNKKSRIYYMNGTGEVLAITQESEGYAIETTKEQDIEIYEQLKNKNISDIDFIELEYGTLASTFNNAKSYKINLENKKLEVTCYSKEELKGMQQQNQTNQTLNNRVSDVTTYLSNNQQTLSDTEDLILRSEQNKILKLEWKM